MADIVIPPSVKRLDAGPTSDSSVFIYTQGILRIGRGVVLRGGSVNLSGDTGIVLEYCTLNGPTYTSVNGPLDAIGVTMHSNYLIIYGRTHTKIDRSRLVGDGFNTVTADEGRLDLTRSVFKSNGIVSLRGELHGDALNLSAPEVDISPGDISALVGQSLLRSSVLVGPSGLFTMSSGYENAQPVDMSRSVVTDSYYQASIYGSPCLIDKGAFRGTKPTVTISP